MQRESKIGSAWFVGIIGGLLFLFSVFLIFREESKKHRSPVPARERSEGLPTATPVSETSKPAENKLPHFETLEFDGEKIFTRTDGNADGVQFSSGDLYERYGGGRDNHPSNTPTSKDRRLWLDARLPLEVSSRLKLYGASTLTLGDTSAATISDYTRNYGIGGGIGFTYFLTPDAELDFDYRHTLPIDAKNSDPSTDSAGISLRLKF
ncbi:MAG: hypothetical protein J6L64_04290 [Opitutales bacterium]|nr:hypothetical protein [Opitutales bacterium]